MWIQIIFKTVFLILSREKKSGPAEFDVRIIIIAIEKDMGFSDTDF